MKTQQKVSWLGWHENKEAIQNNRNLREIKKKEKASTNDMYPHYLAISKEGTYHFG